MINEEDLSKIEFELLTDLSNIKNTIERYSEELESYPFEVYKVVSIIDDKVIIVNKEKIEVLKHEEKPISKSFNADDYICEKFDKWKKIEHNLLMDKSMLTEFCDLQISYDEEHINNEIQKILDINSEYYTYEIVKQILGNIDRFRKEQEIKKQEEAKKEQKSREEVYNTIGEYADDSYYSNIKIKNDTLTSGGDIIATADKPFKDILPFDFWERNKGEIGSMKFFCDMIKETKEAKFKIKPHSSKKEIEIERKGNKAVYLGKTIPLSKVYFVLNNRDSIKSANDISKWVKLPKTMIELLEKTTLLIRSSDCDYGNEEIKCDISFSLIDKENIRIDFLTYSNVLSWADIQKHFIRGRYIKRYKGWIEMMKIMNITDKKEYFEMLKKAKVLQNLRENTNDDDD